MPLGEFAIIDRYFRDVGLRRSDVTLGVGDDAAVLRPPAGCELVATTDTLVLGRHFLADIPAAALGHRSLAVNLSDVAAMGAAPAWALLSLTLPSVDEAWLAAFAAGFGELALVHGVALVGGNLSAGPLSITVQVFGLAPIGTALRRSGARPGDLLYVTGTLGDAAAGLQIEQNDLLTAEVRVAESLRQRYRCPTPRVAAGIALRALASACIDVSDGLYDDLGKLANASGCRAVLDVARLPLSAALRAALEPDAAALAALAGGDDYELCFAIAPLHIAELASAAATSACAFTCIGELQAGEGVMLVNASALEGRDLQGHDHFRG